MKIRVATFALALAMTTPAFAAADWNGTWIGNWESGDGLQLIMAGNVATGMFWHGDYLPDELQSKVSPDGKTLTITWDHSKAVLTRDGGAQTGSIAISEPGRAPVTFPVKVDH